MLQDQSRGRGICVDDGVVYMQAACQLEGGDQDIARDHDVKPPTHATTLNVHKRQTCRMGVDQSVAKTAMWVLRCLMRQADFGFMIVKVEQVREATAAEKAIFEEQRQVGTPRRSALSSLESPRGTLLLASSGVHGPIQCPHRAAPPR